MMSEPVTLAIPSNAIDSAYKEYLRSLEKNGSAKGPSSENRLKN